MDVDKVRAQADQILWYHSIDLGHGVVTRGASKTPPLAGRELPDFRGRTVLDIGAWDGYYSFLAERRGAKRVVALDHYAWGVDIVARDRYWGDCAAAGTLPDHGKDTTDFWRGDLPWQEGFRFAHDALESSVEAVVGDFTTMDLAALGTFDVVLCLGVLYHLKEPLSALERVRSLTREIAVIETEAIHVHGYDSAALLEFHAGQELKSDFGNWFVPSMASLHGLCRAAGFQHVKTKRAYPAPPNPNAGRAFSRRRPQPTDNRVDTYRAAVHAFVTGRAD